MYADELQAVFDKALSEALNESEETVDHKAQTAENKKTTEDGGKMQKSFQGYSEDGKGMYKGNFALGTPKKAKGERILKYIQDVWSKKPIVLRIDKNGQIRYIEAHFDPTYDGTTPTDASKLMGGNRHGTSAEQRVTLDLADDYYQIASESKYNYSKDEEGKPTEPHKEVFEWHYFVNDILFAEYGSDEYKPYRVTINVKERKDGTFVYSFSAEKEGSTTPRTLHAVVSADNEADTNSESFNNSIHRTSEKSKGKVQKSVAGVDSIPDAERKQLQLEIINENNPAPNTYNTWVRSVDDILTLEEALNDSDYEGYDDFTPDYDRGMAEEAIRTGKATVYSSYPIERGVFVSMSRMEAMSYSGNGKVYSKQISINDVAWLDPTQGQYAKVDADNQSHNTRYSRGEEYDPYKPYVHPAYATMPEYSAPLVGKYDYQGEGYTAANGLKLFSKYSVDTARDFIMSELMNCQNFSLCII